MSQRPTLTRRAMLRGFGGALICLPLLEGASKLLHAPMPQAFAASPRETGAKRFIAIMRPNGVEPRFWFPTGGERDFTLGPQCEGFEAVRAHLIMTRGIDNKVALDAASRTGGNGHAEGVASLLTGRLPKEYKGNNWVLDEGPSIDQMIAALFESRGYQPRRRIIHQGEESAGSYNAISIRPGGDREERFGNVDALFERGAEDLAKFEAARARKRSILDGTKDDLDALIKRVSREDTHRVQAHLDAVRSIETRIAHEQACTSFTRSTETTNRDEHRELFNDILVAAMTCDSTRVGTLAFQHSGGGGPKIEFLGIDQDIHELSHQVEHPQDAPDLTPMSGNKHELFTRYHRWYTEKTVSLVNKLKAVELPGGQTLFDGTILFQGSEMAYRHRAGDMPFVILAGADTPMRTGRYVTFEQRVIHNHLLTTLLHAFGLDLDHVGDTLYEPGHLDAHFLK